MKYAYIYEAYRHVHNFIGPFDTKKQMMKALAQLAIDDDEGCTTSETIKDYLNGMNISPKGWTEEECKDLMYTVGVKVFEVQELVLDDRAVIGSWKKEIEAERLHWEEAQRKRQEEQERREYERLKKKFETIPG